ncbi:MAG TPA: lipoyl(octanoyl) transferase LipB [Chthoniobacterales bacterium]|nr:lipoyl(octanoyl) transferase LipB [Chthoniobacterales bacterium]
MTRPSRVAGAARSLGATSDLQAKIKPQISNLKQECRIRWLGRMNFADALAMQEEIVARRRESGNAVDEILLLEHEPVYTIGRTPDKSSLLGAAHLPHPLFAINRGGQATYHGPGQLMCYPLLDLRRCGQDLHLYLRWLEQTLIDFLATYDLSAIRRKGLTGVWIDRPSQGDGVASQRKIASIGVGVRHWITMHGFALNVCDDLSPFAHIVPCGISNVTMTSMEKETGRSLTVADVARNFENLVREKYHELRRDQEAYTISH